MRSQAAIIAMPLYHFPLPQGDEAWTAMPGVLW
jgi:hypothetical protein